jgi:hypothetical protein
LLAQILPLIQPNLSVAADCMIDNPPTLSQLSCVLTLESTGVGVGVLNPQLNTCTSPNIYCAVPATGTTSSPGVRISLLAHKNIQADAISPVSSTSLQQSTRLLACYRCPENLHKLWSQSSTWRFHLPRAAPQQGEHVTLSTSLPALDCQFELWVDIFGFE